HIVAVVIVRGPSRRDGLTPDGLLERVGQALAELLTVRAREVGLRLCPVASKGFSNAIPRTAVVIIPPARLVSEHRAGVHCHVRHDPLRRKLTGGGQSTCGANCNGSRSWNRRRQIDEITSRVLYT